MGIQGLLGILKSIERPVHLKEYTGETLAIDGYSWLHKGAFACAQELGLGQPTDKYVSFFMNRIGLFQHYGVIPFVVFDGGYLPSKAGTEEARERNREANRKKAMDLWNSGRKKEANEQFRRCVDVTPEMAVRVIQALQAAQVQYVVAPYEADPQLAYLEKTGKVQGIVTEDSDLIVFGCQRILFKLDQYGQGTEICLKNLTQCKELTFYGWTETNVRQMCILSGCDYLPSIPGMGLKTAHRLLKKFKTVDKVLRSVRMDNPNMKVPPGYEKDFEKAEQTFLYARVYDVDTKILVHLNLLPEELKDLVNTEEYEFLGKELTPEVAEGVATGRLNPITREPFKITDGKGGCGVSPKPVVVPKIPSSTLSSASIQPPGKENKHPSASTILYIPPRPPPAAASTKSIMAYFGAPTSTTTSKPKLPSHIHQLSATTSVTKRPLAQDTAPELTRKRSFLPIAEAVPSVAISEKPKAADNAVFISKSRFFGFQEEPDEVEQQSLKKGPFREDSGVGLDEASLLAPEVSFLFRSPSASTQKSNARQPHSYDADEGTGSQSQSQSHSQGVGQNSTLSSLDSSQSLVVRGWREKFSNRASTTTAASVVTGSTGTTSLQRAVSLSATTTLASNILLSGPHKPKRSGMSRTGGPHRPVLKLLPSDPVYHYHGSTSSLSLSQESINNSNSHLSQTSSLSESLSHLSSSSPPLQKSSKLTQALPPMKAASGGAMVKSLGGKRAVAVSAGSMNKEKPKSIVSMLSTLEKFKYTPTTTMTSAGSGSSDRVNYNDRSL